MASLGEIPAALTARVNRPPVSVDRYLELARRYEQWCRRRLARNAKKNRKARLAAWLLLGAVLFARPLHACTLWAAAGDRVSGGGTLIAKNRDWRPDHKQVLKLVHPNEGIYSYYCLYALGRYRGAKAGINQKGLVVVSASSPFSRAQKNQMYVTPGLSHKLLANCANVQQAVLSTGWFWGPTFLLLADAKEIALVAIGPEGKYAVTRTENGVLYHTNHYVLPELAHFNPNKKLTSSRARQVRISGLLQGAKAFSPADFEAMAASRRGGPSNALWRTGKKPTSTRTLATWMARFRPGGEAELYVKIANPGEVAKEYRLKASEIFK